MDQGSDKKTLLRGEFKKRVAGYILAGLGLVAGLAWNDAIKALIDSLFPFRSAKVRYLQNSFMRSY